MADALTETEKALVKGLGPFVESALSRRFGPNWVDVANSKRTGPRDKRLDTPVRWDVPDLLRTIDDLWEPVRDAFRAIERNAEVSPTEIRSTVILLKQLRNRARHVPRTPFTDRDKQRFLDLTEQLLRNAACDDLADAVNLLNQTPPEQIKVGEVKPVSPQTIAPESRELAENDGINDTNSDKLGILSVGLVPLIKGDDEGHILLAQMKDGFSILPTFIYDPDVGTLYSALENFIAECFEVEEDIENHVKEHTLLLYDTTYPKTYSDGRVVAILEVFFSYLIQRDFKTMRLHPLVKSGFFALVSFSELPNRKLSPSARKAIDFTFKAMGFPDALNPFVIYRSQE
jgi:hypothetical protein